MQIKHAQTVISGDHNIIIVNNSPQDDEAEEIRKRLVDIMQSHGAVGGDPIKNKMKLQNLETYFTQVNCGKSFASMYRKEMRVFLNQFTDHFTLRNIAGQWFVHANEYDKARGTSEKPKVKPKRKAFNNPTFQRPTQDHTNKKQHTQNKCKGFGDFLKEMNNFRDGNYLLMISKTDRNKYEEALTNIPWLCVFDFDVASEREGLFYRIEDELRAKRDAVYPCTWNEDPHIQYFGTEWCFVTGSLNNQGTVVKDISSVKKWYSEIQKQFELHVKDITKLLDTMLSLTVIAFWPDDVETGRKFEKVLSVLGDSIKPSPQVAVIIDSPSIENRTLIENVEPEHTLREKHEHVLHDMMLNIRPKKRSELSTYELPTAGGLSSKCIDGSLATSYRDSMHVLYLTNPFQTDIADLSAAEEEENLFFKGGTLSWEAYYNHGPEHFYAPRDIFRSIVTDLRRNFIDKDEGGTITIYHAPGAGATTLGQHIIWELHNETPCVQVRSDSQVKSTKIAKQINILHTETRLPIVVLFEGSSNDNIFELIRGKCTESCVVFIHLKRVSTTVMETKDHEYFLSGVLSHGEAVRMGPKFSRCCGNDNDKKDQIQRLVKDFSDGKKHHLIEFGLVTYLHEFTGVRSYVSEYLNLVGKDLSRCRDVLGYLSLVQVFGQGIMPCQLFGSVFGKSDNYMFQYKNFPAPVKVFTVPVDTDFTHNCVRICHYIIAMEILEQILTNEPSISKWEDLSMKAKKNLNPLVLDFITFLKKRQDGLGKSSRTVLDIILQVFIYREYFMHRNERPKLSRLLESIPSEQPFTERLTVMETLADSFPEHPSFWAHLGRAYTILRPTETKKTESHFQKAFVGFQSENQAFTDTVEIDERDTELSYVFHMYGTFYHKRIRSELDNLKRCYSITEMEFQESIRGIFTLATTACDSFDKSTKLRFAGYQETLGCFGEIDVLLVICQFLKTHYQFDTIPSLLEKTQNSEICSFVEDSLPRIQELFLQCSSLIDDTQDSDNFYKKIATYNALFKGMVPNKYLDTIDVADSVHTRRFKIAAIKQKYCNGNQLGLIDNITSDTDIKTLTSLLEQDIAEYKTMNVLESKSGIDHTFLDWLQAIRHEKQRRSYTVEDVLMEVRHWFNVVQSPYARFYLFIMLFTYTVTQDGPCDKNIIEEAMDLKEGKVDWVQAAKTLPFPDRPREWLGKEPGIRCLLPGKSFSHGEKKYIDNDAWYTLKILKGRITHPNILRGEGYIRMDLEGNLNVPIRVRYSPIRMKENLTGEKNVGRRVEFILAFTIKSGLEAYNVMLLNKSTCKHCGTKHEIVSVEQSRKCKCGETVENEFPIKS
ncbi:uncharacterized protein [Argopecten irradians]|uniref:uncharacterized protein n=1 Tax=Argopecten irradians TaxID=31199 RepID=UPI003723C8BA